MDADASITIIKISITIIEDLLDDIPEWWKEINDEDIEDENGGIK